MSEKMSESCPSKDLLVSFLYEEGEAGARAEVERHLAACPACRDEVSGFERVRGHLAGWVPPALDAHLAVAVSEAAPPGARPWFNWPALAGAAAAMLVLGLSAGLANLEVRYDDRGFTMRTGWARQPEAATASAPLRAAGGEPVTEVAPASGTVAEPAGRPDPAPWQGDLAALARQLRVEMASVSPAAGGAVPSPASLRSAAPATQSFDPGFLRQVQSLIDESEVRQQRNLALRVAELARDFDMQRDADLVQIEQGIGRIEGRSEVEAARSREMMNYIQRVSQQQPPR